MRAFYLTLCLLILLFGCQSEDQGTKPEQEKEETATEEAEKQKVVDLKKFLKPDNTVANFLGDGNEFSSYTEKTTWLNDEFVGTIVDNVGVSLMTIYKITKNQIEIVFKEPIDLDTPFPKIEELEVLEPIETYLATPIEEGTSFGQWKIVETNATIETPYKTFEKAIILEEKGENYVNRKYFVEGLGEIKTESIMDTDQGETYTVTSALQSITTIE